MKAYILIVGLLCPALAWSEAEFHDDPEIYRGIYAGLGVDGKIIVSGNVIDPNMQAVTSIDYVHRYYSDKIVPEVRVIAKMLCILESSHEGFYIYNYEVRLSADGSKLLGVNPVQFRSLNDNEKPDVSCRGSR